MTKKSKKKKEALLLAQQAQNDNQPPLVPEKPSELPQKQTIRSTDFIAVKLGAPSMQVAQHKATDYPPTSIASSDMQTELHPIQKEPIPNPNQEEEVSVSVPRQTC